jgi:hypothetical protein
MADDGWGLAVLAAIGVALIAARGMIGTEQADATPASTVLASQVGQQITMSRVPVQSVPADEGFWVNSDHGRVWVQIATDHESPYTVRSGDVVTLRGVVVAHNPDFPGRVGVTAAEGAAGLAAARAHVTIPLNGIDFNA